MPVRHLRGGREQPLFSALLSPAQGETIVSGDGDVRLYRGWLHADRASALLEHIRATALWKHERRTMYDRVVDVPRVYDIQGDDRERPFSEPLERIRCELEAMLDARFAYVLLNRYRDGRDSVAWHNDRSVAGLDRPTIASLTLGATRAFDIRPKVNRASVTSIDLDHGDLIVMRGETQRNYDHRVRKDPRVRAERINLTFRERA